MPSLRWEDWVKRDVRKAREEEDWKKKTRDRGGWKILSNEAAKKVRAELHPRHRENEEEREIIAMIETHGIYTVSSSTYSSPSISLITR